MKTLWILAAAATFAACHNRSDETGAAPEKADTTAVTSGYDTTQATPAPAPTTDTTSMPKADTSAAAPAPTSDSTAVPPSSGYDSTSTSIRCSGPDRSVNRRDHGQHDDAAFGGQLVAASNLAVAALFPSGPGRRRGRFVLDSCLMSTLVTRTYLELRSPADLRPASTPVPAPRVERLGECPASFYRYLYAEVGRAFHWTDRLRWTDEAIRAHLATPGLSVWLLTWEAAPAGYFELKPHADGSTEIAYFGLVAGVFRTGMG